MFLQKLLAWIRAQQHIEEEEMGHRSRNVGKSCSMSQTRNRSKRRNR
jgi:hypothetical protein